MNAMRIALSVTLLCVISCSVARAENVGCMVYNNELRFSEEELQRLEDAEEVQYVGVQVHRPQPYHKDVTARLSRSGKKLIVQIWWAPWSRFSMANIAMDSAIRADFFREAIDPIIESVGPENVHAVHMLEESAADYATDMGEPGDPEDLLDGVHNRTTWYTGFGWDRGGSYGGPWMLTLRRHNEDFRRFSEGYSLFESSTWTAPSSIYHPGVPAFSAFRRWVGQRVQAQANNHFADHLHEKYPNILGTTWDGPNYGGNFWADTPAMLNNIDGFTANCYSAPRQNYIFARSLKVLDYDKELDFIAAVRPWLVLDANARRTALTAIYAVGCNVIGLWHEPNRCYQQEELWKMMRGIFGTFSQLPVFRHSPDVFVIAGHWGVPSQHLKNFDVTHVYDAEGVGLGRYKLVLAYAADHPGLEGYVADGGLAIVFERCPAFLKEEGILVPGENPVEFSGTHEPDDWWREQFGLAESYGLKVSGPDCDAGTGVHKAEGIVYHIPYGKGEVIVLPGRPANGGRDSGWQRFVYDLVKGLLHANGMDEVFEKHFAPWDSGGQYFEITSDDGAVTCYFYYGTGQEGPPVQVRGIDVLTGDKDPVLGPGRSAAIVAHVPTKPWAPPPPPDRTELVRPAPKGARRGLPDLPELPPVHSLGPAKAALEPGALPTWVTGKAFDDWAVDECGFRMVVRFKPTAAAVVDQHLVLSGRQLYELTALDDLSWESVRLFAGGRELAIQVDERDGTSHYTRKGNGRLDYDDELVFGVSLPPSTAVTYELYYDSKPGRQPQFPKAAVSFEEVSTDITDAILSNGRLKANLKGPAKQPGENRIDSHGAGAITECSLDGKPFTRIRQNWSNFFFGNPWTSDGGWTMPELIISGPLRSVVRTHLPHFMRQNEAGLKTFEGTVTNYFAMYGTVPVLDAEQRVEYQWSDSQWTGTYSFYTTVGQSLDPNDLLFVPVEGKPHRVPLVGQPYTGVYREHRPEQGWMALLDPGEAHGCALFYAKMPEVRENLAWVDYAPRRELTPSVNVHPDGYPMSLRYTDRVMQTDNVIDRRFRIVGLTEEDEHAVAAQYGIWGDDLTRLADIEIQLRR